MLVGCVGGGSSFAGFTFPFVQDKLSGKAKGLRIVAVEPMACPSLTKGRYLYDFGDTAGTTPLIKMYTLGHSFIPAPIHSGGLRYHGMAPLVCVLYDQRIIEAVAVHQKPIFEAALQFARAEGIVPAPEPSHAIRVVIDEAIRCRQRGEPKTIAFVLCGHGHFDLGSYQRYLAGQLEDFELPQSAIDEALSLVPKLG
jgi:tryptophan synthase beta chain